MELLRCSCCVTTIHPLYHPHQHPPAIVERRRRRATRRQASRFIHSFHESLSVCITTSKRSHRWLSEDPWSHILLLCRSVLLINNFLVFIVLIHIPREGINNKRRNVEMWAIFWVVIYLGELRKWNEWNRMRGRGWIKQKFKLLIKDACY